MSDFWDVGQFKKTQSGKNRFVKLGYAKKKDDGGFFVNLDALPLPDEQGRVSLSISPPRERSGVESEFRNVVGNEVRRMQKEVMDDDIPW
jgi:hypothetical protein